MVHLRFLVCRCFGRSLAGRVLLRVVLGGSLRGLPLLLPLFFRGRRNHPTGRENEMTSQPKTKRIVIPFSLPLAPMRDSLTLRVPRRTVTV